MRHFPRVIESLFAGAGVGITGVNHDSLAASFFCTVDTELHRRRTNLVGGEHSSNCRGYIRNDKCQVALLSFVRAFAGAESFDIAEHARRAEAFRSDNGARDVP